VWLQAAVDDLIDIAITNSRQAHRIVLVVRSFERDGQGDLKKLQGSSEAWRLRAGDWRCEFERTGSRITVSRISNRRDAY